MKRKKAAEKKLGRPRSVSSASAASMAVPITTRFDPGIVDQIERLARAGKKKRGDLIRELVEEALAGRETGRLARLFGREDESE